MSERGFKSISKETFNRFRQVGPAEVRKVPESDKRRGDTLRRIEDLQDDMALEKEWEL